MSEQIVAFTGSVPVRVRRAFSFISSIARVAWGVEGEYFFVWLDSNTNSQIHSLGRAYGLVVQMNTMERTGTPEGAQQGNWLSVEEHQDKVADEEYEEEIRQQQKSNWEIFNGDPQEIARKSREENLKKATQGSRPPDDEFLATLQELGVDETAKKYGRKSSTIVNVWVGSVKGAGDILRNLSPEKRGTFRIKEKSNSKSKKPG